MVNYPPLGVISHRNRQILRHCAGADAPWPRHHVALVQAGSVAGQRVSTGVRGQTSDPGSTPGHRSAPVSIPSGRRSRQRSQGPTKGQQPRPVRRYESRLVSWRALGIGVLPKKRIGTLSHLSSFSVSLFFIKIK